MRDHLLVIMVGPIIIIGSKSVHLPNDAVHIVFRFSSPAHVILLWCNHYIIIITWPIDTNIEHLISCEYMMYKMCVKDEYSTYKDNFMAT